MIGAIVSWVVILLVTPLAVLWRLLCRPFRQGRRATGWRAPRTVMVTMVQMRRPF